MMYIGLIYNKRNRYGYEQPVEQFFFTMDQNFFLNKIPFLNCPGSQTTVTVKTEKGEVLKTVISLFPVILVRKNMEKYLKAVTNVKPVIFPQTPQISKNCYSLSKTCYFSSQDMENKKKKQLLTIS